MTPNESTPHADDARPESASANAARAENDHPFSEPASAASQASEPVGGMAEAIEMEQIRAELAEAQQRTLRAQAELENFRKRARREEEENRRYAMVPLLKDLLPVLDNVDRAIAAAEKTQDATSLLEGFKMVRQQLGGVLERHQCVEISAQGEPFDPHLHEAICGQPSEEHAENTVLDVVQTGFQLHDRVIRPSQVIVSTPPQ